jgi:hypothetical protein
MGSSEQICRTTQELFLLLRRHVDGLGVDQDRALPDPLLGAHRLIRDQIFPDGGLDLPSVAPPVGPPVLRPEDAGRDARATTLWPGRITASNTNAVFRLFNQFIVMPFALILDVRLPPIPLASPL